MRYKVGDKVKIRSLEWYNENKDEDGDVLDQHFVEEMSKFCGMQATITYAYEHRYSIDLDDGEWSWTDEMFEEPSNCAMGIKKPSYKLNVKNMEQKKTFEPFERVLVCGARCIWIPAIYCFYDNEAGKHYTSEGYAECDCVIPFAGNSHLVGTTDMPCEEVKLKDGELIVASDSIDYITKGLGNIRKFQGINDYCICISLTEFYKYCIPFSKFNPNDMEETKKHILCVKNGKLVRARV